MCNLREIEARPREEPSRLRGGMVSDIGLFTVALFAVFGSQERLQLAGTGTLVTAYDSHYILTAAHVWERVLRRASHVGITLRENTNHRFLIMTNAITTAGPAQPSSWNEWGPDIILLRIPAGDARDIEVHRVFYNLTKEREVAPDIDSLEAYVLMGTPEVSGQFTTTHAEIEINGQFMQANPTHRVHGDLDFLDFDVDVSLPGVPEAFGGVSGGGLWTVRFFCQKSSGQIRWHKSLVGIAFHQSDLVSGHRTIRCHAQQSIRSAVAHARPNNKA